MKKENYEFLKENYENNLYTATKLKYVRMTNKANREQLAKVYKEEGFNDLISWNCSTCIMTMFTRLGKLYYEYKEKEPTIKTLAEINKEPEEEITLETVIDNVIEIKDIKKDAKLLKVSKKVNKTKKK